MYLFVPPEEYAEVQALGARWDPEAKCWYIAAAEAPSFSRWLPSVPGMNEADTEPYTIVADELTVATAMVPCRECGAEVEVICLHCRRGTVAGEPLQQFTIAEVSGVDAALAAQLQRWPHFRRTRGADPVFANHCPSCGATQDDLFLHTEPEHPFFDVATAISAGGVTVTPLSGTLRLSGDEHLRID